MTKSVAYIGGRQSKKLHNLLKNATIGMLFVVIRPGCPHCDKLKEDGVFETMENKLDPIDNQPQVVVVNSEAISDPDDPVSAEPVFQNIKGVPEITLRSKNGTVKKYNGPRSADDLIKTVIEENNKENNEDDATLVLGNNVPLSMTGGRRRRKHKRTVKRRRKHTVKHHRKHKKHTRGRKHHRVRRHAATKHRRHHRRTSRAARTYRRY